MVVVFYLCPSEKAQVNTMDTPPLTPQTACEYINNTDYFNKDNCLFIDTNTTTSSNSPSGYFGEDLFGPTPQNSTTTTTTTTTQGFFPPILEPIEGDYFFTTTTTNNNIDNDNNLQDVNVMDDDDIFAEINDTLNINDNLQSSTYPITTDDFTLF